MIPSKFHRRAMLILFVTAFSAYTTNACAISHKYREALERSGCNQQTELQGCDIHKSAAWNARHGFGPEATVKNIHPSPDSALPGSLVGQHISDAAEHLLSSGWKPNQGNWHKGSKTLVLTVKNETITAARIE